MEKLAIIQKNEILEIKQINESDFDTTIAEAKETYGETDLEFAYVTDYDVIVGDTYNMGMFYHNGVRVYANSSNEKKIESLQASLTELEARVSALEG